MPCRTRILRLTIEDMALVFELRNGGLSLKDITKRLEIQPTDHPTTSRWRKVRLRCVQPPHLPNRPAYQQKRNPSRFRRLRYLSA